MAQELAIPGLQPNDFKSEESLDELSHFHPVVLSVAAYGLILPTTVLELPKYGCINVHASLLPRWRGAAPIERAVMAGDTQTGVGIMQMEKGLDTGPVFLAHTVAINNASTVADLEHQLAVGSAQLLIEVLNSLPAQTQAQAQSEAGITYAAKLTPAHRRVNWHNSAAEIE